MDFSFSDLNLQLDGQKPINFNSVVIDKVAMLPNKENLPGFEVVSTSNLTPSSKLPIDRLVGYMLVHRDDCIAAINLHERD